MALRTPSLEGSGGFSLLAEEGDDLFSLQGRFVPPATEETRLSSLGGRGGAGLLVKAVVSCSLGGRGGGVLVGVGGVDEILRCLGVGDGGGVSGDALPSLGGRGGGNSLLVLTGECRGERGNGTGLEEGEAKAPELPGDTDKRGVRGDG